MNHPGDPRSIQPDERSYVVFAPGLLPRLESLGQRLVEMQRGVAPSATATARIALLQKSLADTQEQDDPAYTPETRAALQCALAIAYQQCLDGDRAQQMEAALGMCEEALQVYTLAQYPYQYASIQVTLGNVYRERAAGAQRDNLDRSFTFSIPQAVNQPAAGAEISADEYAPLNEAQLVAVRGRANRFDAAQAQDIIQADAEELAPDACPYADPYYWAGFQITGW